MLKQDTNKLKENPCVFFEVTALKHEAMFILLLSIVFLICLIFVGKILNKFYKARGHVFYFLTRDYR